MLPRYLPVVLYWLSVLAAAGLAGLVVLAPRYEQSGPLVQMYAADVVLRRVTLAGAAGLAATAFIFFRATPVRYGQVRRPDGSVPEITDLAGA